MFIDNRNLGRKVKCLFQNGDYGMTGTIVKLHHGNKFIDIYYDHGVYEAFVPIGHGKFIMKENEKFSVNQSIYSWICGHVVDINGDICEIVDVKKSYQNDMNLSTSTLKSIYNNHTFDRPCKSIVSTICKTLYEKCKVNEKCFIYPCCDAWKVEYNTLKKKMDMSNNISQKNGSYNGTSMIFVQKIGQGTNLVSPKCLHVDFIKSQLPYECIAGGVTFIQNTNLHSIKTYCTGVLCAYTDDTSLDVKRPNMSSNTALWKLGIILYHSVEETAIIPTFLYFEVSLYVIICFILFNVSWRLLYKFYSATSNLTSLFLAYKNGKRRFELSRYPVKVFYHLNSSNVVTRSVTIVYLNHVTAKCVAQNGCIKSLISGPDIVTLVPFTKTQKKCLQSFKCDVINILSSQHCLQKSLSKGRTSSNGLLNKKSKNSANKRKSNSDVDFNTICAAGTTIVSITCQSSFLKNVFDEKVLLIPYVQEGEQSCNVNKECIKYAIIPFSSYESLSNLELSPREYNSYISKLSRQRYTQTRLISPDKVKNGVVIQFIADENVAEPLISEYVTTVPLEHTMLEGVVLSHWITISDDQSIHIRANDIFALNQTFGSTGFGSRHSVQSKGLNVYLGMKNNSRVLASPRMAFEDICFSQMWRNEYEETFAPIAYNVVNKLTKQASGVMIQANRLYDRFLMSCYEQLLSEQLEEKSDGKGISLILPLSQKAKRCNSKAIKKMKYENKNHEATIYKNRNQCVRQQNQPLGKNNIISHRRMCNWSIVTSGSSSSKCYSFANSPHVDTNDKMSKKFQKVALDVLADLKNQTDENDCVTKKELEYLSRLYDTCNGFCLPTTCGYKVIKSMSELSDVEEKHLESYFCLLGLGVSVKLTSNLYHYFLGGCFSHCTPVTVSIKDGIVRTYTRGINVFAWGGGGNTNTNTICNHVDQAIA